MTSLAEQLVAITETMTPEFPQKEVFVMAGDHGVAEEGVSRFPQGGYRRDGRISFKVVRGSTLLPKCGAKVNIVDLGVDAKLDLLYGKGKVINRKIGYGTKNMTKSAAMSREDAVNSWKPVLTLSLTPKVAGRFDRYWRYGNRQHNTQHGGICCLKRDQSQRSYRSRHGLDDAAIAHKVAVIDKALMLHRSGKTIPLPFCRNLRA